MTSASALPNLSGMPLAAAAGAASQEDVRRFVEPHLRGADLEVRIDKGSVWDRIVRDAADEKADLIAMATRGLDSRGDRLLGSNAERVVRHASCPVLVI